MTTRSTLVLTLAVVIGASMLEAGAVRGGAVACGDEVAQDVVLVRDLGPCVAGGLVVVADDVTVDLGGHRVFGTAATGDGAGITVRRAFRATVKHGSVTGFDAGIVIDAGGSNRVRDVRSFSNIGAGTQLGDGVLISGSSNNIVERSKVYGNGPFSGVSVFSPRSDPNDAQSPRIPAAGNKIVDNHIHDNRLQLSPTEMSDAGIRLEAGTSSTNIRDNRISYNGLDGIVVFAGSTRNRVRENVLKANGHHVKDHRVGDGIRVFGTGAAAENRIERNRALRNAGHGVAMSAGAVGNVIVRNEASHNSAAGFFGPDPSCTLNRWRRNRGGSFAPSCTRGR